MTAQSLALSHYRARQRLVRAVEAEGLRLWQSLPRSAVLRRVQLERWSESLSRLAVVLAGAQLAAARQADDYVDAALAAQGVSVAAAGSVAAGEFSGVASDGRPLDSLLHSPVVSTRVALSRGATMPRALASGQATLSMILRTQVADAGRVADGVAIAARPQVGYVRMLNGKSCSRCAILAGKYYRYNSGFQRHPGCDCIHVPAKGEAAAKSEGLVSDPKEYFDSLAPDEQAQVFTKAGAEAIRDGADLNQVVNARRGMATAGTTTEGATRRGIAGQGLRGRERWMPERIYREAASQPEAIRLLRLHGYLL